MDEMTRYAQDGWDIQPQNAYPSSPVGMAQIAGLLHRAAGLPRPSRAAMSRGYSVRVDGVVYKVEHVSLRQALDLAQKGA